MATYDEVAVHGIAGSADVLPVPGGLGVEDPHDSPLHHDYRVPRDLPETGVS